LVTLAPLLGVGGLLLLFAGTEWLRSWSAHYVNTGIGFWSFSISRLVTYYYTALNNGAGMLKFYEWPTWSFGTVIGWYYRFPLIGAVTRAAMPGQYGNTPETFLSRFADMEFNNMSGIFPVFFDAGIAGGLIIAFLWGVLMGYLYRTFRYGNGIGVVLYPVTYISMLEVMRVFYMGASRAFPSIFILLVAYLLLMKRREGTLPMKKNESLYVRIA
jgi:hypothetical protein